MKRLKIQIKKRHRLSEKEISVARGPFMRASPKAKVTQKAQQIATSFRKANEGRGLRIFVAGGSRSGNNPIYEQEAYKLGEKIAQMNFRLDFGLSGHGIMGAVAKGMLAVWGRAHTEGHIPIKGITTKEYMALTQKDEVVNQVKDVIVAHTLEERKNQLLRADFVIFAPGGLGTLDELVYDCVAMQDGFLPLKPFIIFNVNGHYHHILEYLKEIHLKGFAEQTPFIVVDDSFEAGVAFEVLKEAYQTPPPKEKVYDFVQRIIYELPYILERKVDHPDLSISKIRQEMLQRSNTLAPLIEKAYLRKEIDRMYGRLERTGHDTAVVSEKLSGLKAQRRKVLA